MTNTFQNQPPADIVAVIEGAGLTPIAPTPVKGWPRWGDKTTLITWCGGNWHFGRFGHGRSTFETAAEVHALLVVEEGA